MPLATSLRWRSRPERARRRCALLASPKGYEDGIANAEIISDVELQKLKDKRAKTRDERQQERKADLGERYGVEVTASLVEKDDDGWYPQLRLHYFLTLGREHLVSRDATRAKSQIEAGENAVWKPDFNRGQLLPLVLLLESLNIGHFLTPGVMFRGSDMELQQLKVLAVQHRYIIKNYLGISISEELSEIAIPQRGCQGHRSEIVE